MKNKNCMLTLLIAFFLGFSCFAQALIEKSFFESNTELGSDVIIKKSTIKVEGIKSFKIFEIEATDNGYYYMNAWVSGAELEKFGSGKFIEYELVVNDEIQIDKFKPAKNNWQNASYIDLKTTEKKTVKLNKGLNQIIFSCEAPMIPDIDFISLSQDKAKSEILDSRYAQFVKQIEQDMENRVEKPISIEDSLHKLKNGIVLSNPGGNYNHHHDATFKYTYYTFAYFTTGQQVFIATNATNFQHVLEFFSSNNPQSYSWTTTSNSNSIASINVTIPNTGYYIIKVRSWIQSQQGLVNLNINGQYYYSNCVASGYAGFRHSASPGTYNYFTCKISGDTRIWLEDNIGFPGRIVAFNDDYYGSGDYSWGLASRINKNFTTQIEGDQFSSYSSYTPTGTCDYYIMVQNSTGGGLPYLKADDAMKSGIDNTWYNCASWGAGYTDGSYGGPGFPYCFGFPWGGQDLLEKLDNCYGNVTEDGIPLFRWNPEDCPTYTRTGANQANAEIGLCGSLSSIIHVAVTNYANNFPHGYDWESKCGEGPRVFHAFNSNLGYGAISSFYTRVQQKKSQGTGIDGLSYEESIRRGSTAIDVVDYSITEQTKISQLQGMVSDNEKLVFDYLFSKIKTKWDFIDKSNLAQIPSILTSNEYQEALNYFQNKPGNRCLLYTKIDEVDGLAIMLLGDISKQKNETLMEEVLSENLKNQYTEDGIYIAPSIVFNVKKYVKKLLNITDEQGNVTYALKGVSTNVIDNTSFSVFPNPVKDNVTISFSIFEELSIAFEVCDIADRKTGIHKQKQSYHSGPNAIDLDLSGLKQGIYICNIILKDCTFTRKLVKK
jgi:hypothetical protein